LLTVGTAPANVFCGAAPIATRHPAWPIVWQASVLALVGGALVLVLGDGRPSSEASWCNALRVRLAGLMKQRVFELWRV